MQSTLLGLNQIEVRIELADGVTEIPIGAEFGIELGTLSNPESTRPSDSFYVKITDSRDNLVSIITQDEALLANFVMRATVPG